ncbi:MAG: alpha-amylase family glycosyl hydrolase, partial [Prevotella sp.]
MKVISKLKFWLFALLVSLPLASQADYVDDINYETHSAGQQVIYEMNVGAFTPEGTFSAATKRLPELKRIGVDIVWLMPVYPRGGGINSPYAATDFKATNPSYGTVDNLKELVTRAHELNMKVWLDWVPNHTATDAKWVTTHPEYYTRINGEFVHPNNYNDVYQLNYSNPDLCEAMNDCLKYWVQTVDVDGFRCDYVSSQAIPASYWNTVIPMLKSLVSGKDIQIMAETDLTDSNNKRLANVGFDYDYAWGFQSKLAQYGADGNLANPLMVYAQSLIDASSQLQVSRMVYLTNHDQNYNEQKKTLTEKYGANRYLLTVFAHTIMGMPLIYNGQEIGGNQPLNYFTDEKIDWTNTDPQMTNTLRTLSALKHSQKALQDGKKPENNPVPKFLSTINQNPNILAYSRTSGESEVVVVINTGTTAQTVLLQGFSGNYSLWLNSETIGKGVSRKTVKLNGSLSFALPAKGYRVYVKGAFSDEDIESVPTTLSVLPSSVSMMTGLPEKLEILSLNNSLINYARQDTVFNHIAESMNVDAVWTSHSNIGKSLDYHWNETDTTGNNVEGQPSAKTMISSKPWTHIILQEQTEKPRKKFQEFRQSVKQWVEYIRSNCPNPHAVIVVPVNWPLLIDADNYKGLSDELQSNYASVAQEFGLVLAPVGQAYEQCYLQEGKAGLTTWFRPAEENNGLGQDDRHPSQKATYMAACIEFGVITGKSVSNVAYRPSKISEEEADAMRQYASSALSEIQQIVDVIHQTVQFKAVVTDQFGNEMIPSEGVSWQVSGGGQMDGALFKGQGEKGKFVITAMCRQLTSTATLDIASPSWGTTSLPVVELKAKKWNEDFNGMKDQQQLPEGWRIDRITSAPRTLGSFEWASENVMYLQTAENLTLPSNAKNGTWAFGTTEDRALGGITTGIENGTKSVNLYVHLWNVSGAAICNPYISYKVEKYRKGANSAGFNVELYWSKDGRAWNKAGDVFSTYFEPDEVTEGYTVVPGLERNVDGTLPLEIADKEHFYLAWNVSAASGSACNAAQALAIDDFNISWDETDSIAGVIVGQNENSCTYDING